jgi:KTSC domain
VRTRWFGLLLPTLLALCDLSAADRNIEPVVSRIKREPVDSSALAAIGYSKKFHILEIEFRDGTIYRYEEVPGRVYRELISAESKATHYNKNIRGHYHCLRVRPPARQKE